MKIKFLGTSCGIPMPNRHYQSVLIEVDDALYLFDAGAPVMDCLITEGYDLTKLRAVFITHAHPDHMLGVLDIINLASLYYTDMRFDVYVPEKRCADAVTAFCTTMLSGLTCVSDKIRFVEYKQGEFYNNGKLAVTAHPTAHMVNGSSYGFLIETEGKRIYQTGDMGSTLEDFPTELLMQKTDVVISECAHFPAALLIEKLNQACVEKVMVVHIFPKDKYDTLVKSVSETQFELILPNDGEEYIV